MFHCGVASRGGDAKWRPVGALQEPHVAWTEGKMTVDGVVMYWIERCQVWFQHNQIMGQAPWHGARMGGSKTT